MLLDYWETDHRSVHSYELKLTTVFQVCKRTNTCMWKMEDSKQKKNLKTYMYLSKVSFKLGIIP